MKIDRKVTIANIIMIVTLLITGARWTSAVDGQLVKEKEEVERLTSQQERMANELSKLGVVEAAVSANTKANDRFISRFDDYLTAQSEINSRFLEVAVRQEEILRRLAQTESQN